MNYPKSYVYEQIKNKARGHLYYLKSEADKVIDELKHDVEMWIGSYEASRRVNARTESKIRHSNYKRCLAMAKWCLFWKNYWHCCEPTDLGAFIARERFFSKWQKRWLKIAEKFKEVK